MKALRVGQILREIERLAPAGTAEDWDNVGLLVGDPEWETSSVLASVDLTEEVIARAVAAKARLIVNHHPCIFPGGARGRGLLRLTPDSPAVRALREGIAVAACHTNFDQCAMEVVEAISKGLGAHAVGRLIDFSSGSLLKLVTFVPIEALDAVRAAVFEAGAGHIGRYDSCAFTGQGEGSFRGETGTTPFLGKPGQLERAAEARFETVLPRGLRRQVVEALVEAHPYEEVAYDLIPVEQGPAGVGLIRGLGYGFWGEFDAPKPFSEVAEGVKRLFKLNGYLLTESSAPSTQVKKIAFVAGKGSSFLDAAAQQGCDLFITGEAGYHAALGAARRGMSVIELGHRDSEHFFAPTVQKWLAPLGLEVTAVQQKTQVMTA